MINLGAHGPASEVLEALAGTFDSEVARRLGMARNSIVRHRQRGLTIYRADELACAFGRHPAEWWPNWFDLPQDEAKECRQERLWEVAA